ncbi:MAG: hypothetical protein KDA41_11080, partial [Planctomycetales bacterium]|nr:hypothetical protein [Planctomycetales bacterium]
RAREVLGHSGVSVGLFPTFADEASQQRFFAISSVDDQVHRKRREQEAEEAAWLLGVMLTVQTLPGGGDRLLQVLAGERNAVAARGGQLCEAAWAFDVERRASLVVASVAGGSEQQTWDNFARALHAARQLALPGGAIALCTELATAPGAALQRLAAGDTFDEALSELRRDRTADALPAAELRRALESHHVFLLSRLDADFVESLGVAPVESAEDIARLSTRHESCILLGAAQFAAPHAPQGAAR